MIPMMSKKKANMNAEEIKRMKAMLYLKYLIKVGLKYHTNSMFKMFQMFQMTCLQL